MHLAATDQQRENKRLFLYVWALLLLVWLLSFFAPLIFKTGRYVFDLVDLLSYYDRAGWVLAHQAPVSEYPQIPTYLFGLNAFISGWFSASVRFPIFYSLTVFEMIVALYLTIRLLSTSFPSDRRYRSLLLLLPPTLYFVAYRFDILPALLCTIALKMAHENKWGASSIVLAFATFTKWYPILLFPGFLVCASIQEHKLQWKMLVLFLATSFLLVVPTYFQGGTEALLFPYRFHLARGMEFVSLPALVSSLLVDVADVSKSQQHLRLCFAILQISSPVLVILFKPDTFRRLVHYSIIAISLFILFSRINSPQWILWLLPFLIISIENTADVWLIVLYNISTYLFFPVAFDLYGPSSVQLQLLGFSNYLILALFVVRSFIQMGFGVKLIPHRSYLHRSCRP